MLAELKSARQAHDDFVATLAYEVRGRLAPMVNALELLRLRGAAPHGREFGVLARQTQQLVELVDQMLRVSAPRSFVSRPVPLARVLTHAVESVSSLLEERRHRLDIRLSDNTLECDGDESRLTQMLSHLLQNAALFTPPGGSIEVSAALSADEVVLRVRDNGVGMTCEVLSLAWSPFFQGPAAGSGMGMGLTLVKTLVNLHGGTVTAFSEGPGRGSEFVVNLPRRASPPQEALEPVPRETARPARILVVDDNEDAAYSLAALLQTQGHQVLVSVDPQEALRVADDFVPEVALFDIEMPGLDGHQLLARMRNSPWSANCRFIAISAHGQRTDQQLSRQAGFERHLTKPLSLDSLIRLLRQQHGPMA